ncbi:unnamed protein product, partial [marine sediment metagenome]
RLFTGGMGTGDVEGRGETFPPYYLTETQTPEESPLRAINAILGLELEDSYLRLTVLAGKTFTQASTGILTMERVCCRL